MITDPQLAAILAAFGESAFLPSTSLLFEFGDVADGAYVVQSGCVDLIMLDTMGKVIWSKRFTRGGILGLPPAVGKFPHYFRAIVACDAEVVFIPAAEVLMLINAHAAIGSRLLSAMKDELLKVRSQYTSLKVPVRSKHLN